MSREQIPSKEKIMMFRGIDSLEQCQRLADDENIKNRFRLSSTRYSCKETGSSLSKTAVLHSDRGYYVE